MSEADDTNQRPELRELLLASATRMFLERPYDEVRVDDIATAAGVAKGLVFYYFESKRGIYVAVVESLLDQLVAQARPDIDLPPRQREIAAVESFVNWAAEVEGVEIILTTWSAGDSQIDAMFSRALARIVAQMVGAMGDIPGGPGADRELPETILSRSIRGWLSFARIVTADWLRTRDLEPEQLRDLLVGALDGAIAATIAVAAAKRPAP